MMGKMRISFSCIDAASDPLNWIYRVDDAGFDGLEIISEGKQDIRTSEQLREHLKQIHDTTSLTISLHAPLSDINIASLNDGIWRESVRQVKQAITYAHEFVSEICVVHPGTHSPLSIQMPSHIVLHRQVDALKEICDLAADFGMSIAVENMTPEDMMLGRTPDELITLIDAVIATGTENIGICLDVGHAFTTGTLHDFMLLLKNKTDSSTAYDKRILHVHLSDNFGREDEHLPLGRGHVKWNIVFDALRNFKGIAVTEMLSFEDGIESLRFIRRGSWL